MERQLTCTAHGHILTNANVWSPCGKWIVYDVRRDPAGSKFDGTRIERVHVETGEVQVLYESRRGACCGVASYSPVDDRVAFILGPEDPTPDWQYCAWHRRGVILHAERPGVVSNLDARNVAAPFTPGALRGGSHVHLFSGDGQWVSFTYEDHVLAANPATLKSAEGTGQSLVTPRSAEGSGLCAEVHDLNQRNVAVAAPFGPVRPAKSHPRNHDGEFFSVVVTRTVNEPTPGSDEISRAYEDAWIGANGYRRSDGRWQTRALAFLGDVVDERGKPLTELFVVDLPDDVTKAGDGLLQGTPTRRPAPPARTVQRRLTFTANRKYPGVQGPRHWPRSSTDGSQIALLMRDDAGVVQLWTISPNGGQPRQISADPWGLASAFTWDPLGERMAYIADNSVMTVDVESGKTTRLTPRSPESLARPEACVFSPSGQYVAYVRQMPGPGGLQNQIFVVDA
ncbi:MAG TPA: DUF3748 domain-containing protein [Lacipirellula sp.]